MAYEQREDANKRQELVNLVNELKKYGLIPSSIEPRFSRGRDESHRFMVKLLEYQNNKGGIVIDLLQKALKQEVNDNGDALLAAKTAMKPACGEKLDFFNAAVEQLTIQRNKQDKEYSLMSIPKAVASWGIARLTGQQSEPTKPMTITQAAAEAKNPEATAFKTNIATKEESKQQAEPSSPSIARKD